MKVNKKILSLFLILILTLSLTGCGAATYDSASAVAVNGSDYYMATESYSGGMNYDYSDEDYDYTSEKSEIVAEEAEQNNTEKLVYTAKVSIETKDMKQALEVVHGLISNYDGFIQEEDTNGLDSVYYDSEFDSSYTYSNRSGAYASITLRVPQENYEEFLNKVNEAEGILYVTGTSKTVDNMTSTYYDIDSRLSMLRLEEQRLFDFMEAADEVSDMLEIEERLQEVQYQIESATNSLRDIDNDVAYSTITISIDEVINYTITPEVEKTLGQRIAQYFSKSFQGFGEFLEGLLKGAIYVLPYAVIFGLIIFAVLKITKPKTKRGWFDKKKKPAAEEKPDE